MNKSNLEDRFKSLIVSDKDKLFGLTVSTVGLQVIEPNKANSLSGHPEVDSSNTKQYRALDEYQIIYITQGYGKMLIENHDELTISKGQVIILFPGQMHSYFPDEKMGWHKYSIGFSGEIIDRYIENSFFSKNTHLLDIGINQELVNLFNQAIEVAYADRVAAQQNLLGIVMHMIGLLLYESQKKQSVE